MDISLFLVLCSQTNAQTRNGYLHFSLKSHTPGPDWWFQKGKSEKGTFSFVPISCF